jgi:hypothetical protein
MSNQINLNNFNSFINQASNAIMCDANCQKQKQSEQLKQIFQNAEANLVTSEGQVQVAEKNYITYVGGPSAYNDFINKKLKQEAREKANKINQLVDVAVADISASIDTYEGLLLNFKNVVELHNKYTEDNKNLEKDLKNETHDVLTNDRKTYYENQEVDNLKFYYVYFLLTIYVIIVICFIIFGFIYPSQNSPASRLFIFIGLLILPFFSSWLLASLIEIIYYLYSLLPKNVYKNKY